MELESVLVTNSFSFSFVSKSASNAAAASRASARVGRAITDRRNPTSMPCAEIRKPSGRMRSGISARRIQQVPCRSASFCAGGELPAMKISIDLHGLLPVGDGLVEFLLDE